MYSIERHLASVVERRAKSSKSILLTGARGVGKSTLFRHVFQDVRQVTFDDGLLLCQATDDVGLFLMNHPAPLMIDEIQKCPAMIVRLKLELDNTDEHEAFLLTGSQRLRLMEGLSESLAGRVSIVEMNGLSLREINHVDFHRHFVPTQEYIAERETCLKQLNEDIWTTIHRGSYPELYSDPAPEWHDYYRSYVRTFLERDVNRQIRACNQLTFVKFMTTIAARTGQVLNYKAVADQVGVSEGTVKNWVSILEESGLVYLLKPYTASSLNRAIKSPKLYFRDTGLCCYLTRWLTPETLKYGMMAGAMFETFVVNEILKSCSNEGLDDDLDLFFYKSRDRRIRKVDGAWEGVAREIKLIIQEGEVLHPIEIRTSTMPKVEMAAEFDVLNDLPDKQRGMGAIVCLIDRKLYLRENLVALPLWYI